MGWIEAICGPMFSGKSEELIRRLRRAVIARKRVQVFKPAIDNRYSVSEIVTHADVRMRSEPVDARGRNSGEAGLAHTGGGRGRIEFFWPRVGGSGQSARRRRQTDHYRRLRYRLHGPAVYAHAGLAGCRRVHHENAGNLHALRCSGQAYPATHGFGRVDHGGADGAYEARCRRCFEPGIPSRKRWTFERELSVVTHTV